MGDVSGGSEGFELSVLIDGWFRRKRCRPDLPCGFEFVGVGDCVEGNPTEVGVDSADDSPGEPKRYLELLK